MIVPVTRLRIGSGIQLAAEEGDKCNAVDISQETGPDLTIKGLSETGLSSSISNQFVSAAIVTDKQSAGNIIWQNVIQPQLDLKRWLSLTGLETGRNQFKRHSRGKLHLLKPHTSKTKTLWLHVLESQKRFSYLLFFFWVHTSWTHFYNSFTLVTTYYLVLLALPWARIRSSCSPANGSCMLIISSESADAAKFMAGCHSLASTV